MQLAQTGANFNPQNIPGGLEESIGNLDAKGTTTSHWMKGNFDQSQKNIGNPLDIMKEKNHRTQSQFAQNKAQVTVSLGFFDPSTAQKEYD